MSPDEPVPGEARPARPIVRPIPHLSPGSEPPSYRSLRRVDQLAPRAVLAGSSSSAVLQVDDLALCDPDVLAAATERSEQRARQLIPAGMPEECALAHAVNDAPDYARRLVADHVQQQDRQAALDAVVDAYAGDTYRLLRDLANALGASVAYVDRPTVEPHLDRCLSDAQWTAIVEQLGAMDLVDAVGDQGQFRTHWIETVVERAGITGHAYAADGVDSGADPLGAA